MLMSTLSESDRLRADRRERTGRENERERETVRAVDNGGVVVLRRLVKGQSRQNQTATIPRDLNASKLLQVWPKQLGVTALPLNEIRLMSPVCRYVCVRICTNETSQSTKVFTGTITTSWPARLPKALRSVCVSMHMK